MDAVLISMPRSIDVLQAVSDRRQMPFMYSYPSYFLMYPNALHGIRCRFEGYGFDDAHGYTWGLNILGSARSNAASMPSARVRAGYR